MSRRLTGCLTVGALLALSVGAAPVAAGDTGTVETGTQTEAWYRTVANDACETELDCSLLTPPVAFPEGTLHVDIDVGKPTAATYLELDTFGAGIPAGSVIKGGTLSLPVNTAPGDGALRPDEAQLLVCQVSDFFSSAEGSLAEPPAAECDAASSPAVFTADPEPVFTVDLTAFATTWAEGGSAALAVVPAPEAEEANETWHVVFWGKDNDADDAVPITAELAYGPAESFDDVTPPPMEPPLDMGDALPPFDDGEFDVPPLDEFPVDELAVPEVGDAPEEVEPAEEAEPAPEALAAEPTWRTVGYAYPAAWLMPLLLLAGFGVTGRSLTKNLTPQAPSALRW